MEFVAFHNESSIDQISSIFTNNETKEHGWDWWIMAQSDYDQPSLLTSLMAELRDRSDEWGLGPRPP